MAKEKTASRIPGGLDFGTIKQGVKDAIKRKDAPFALGVVGILLVLLLPVPTFLLDLLLALSITFAILILMTVLYLEKPLYFSSFPSILLVSALFRLSLNIASTRLILSHGHNGAAAAGHIIEAFAGFVMAGNLLIGLIVFAILTIINFVVITKGSGRIAEVGARFSLDAMPGKQMAIDADLSAGLIDEKEAKARREELQSESTFYGAMDGASKFVRGDAIAGLMITFINLIGGMIIGIVQKDMDFAAAADAYTKLTVGDGLVSQIPALVISTAAGMLISKAGGDGTANKMIATQLTKNAEAVAMVSGLMFCLALVPSVPAVPFLVLSGGTGYLAYRIYASRGEAAEKTVGGGAGSAKPAPGAPSPVAGGDKKAGAAGQEETPVADALKIDPIRLELGYGLLPLVNYKSGTPLPQQVKTLRQQMAKDIGFVLPSVRIQDNMEIPHYEYLIRVKEVECARGKVRPDMLLVMNPSGGEIQLAGEDDKEPAFGLPAKWVSPGLRDEAMFRNYTVVDPPTVIMTHLTETVKDNVTDLLSYSETQKLIDETASQHKKLVDDAIPDKITVSGLQRILQNLLSERVSIRDLPTILEAALEAASLTKSIEQITEYVRRQLSRQICRAYVNPEGVLEALMLSPVWEQLFLEGLHGTGDEKRLAVPPTRLQEFVNAVKRNLTQQRGKGLHPVLIVHPTLRPHVHAVLDRALPGTAVLSQGEIHPKIKLRTLGQI
ncbi:MAG: flagellar biosynthesis protein FlhA [Rickettsiales bacterium]